MSCNNTISNLSISRYDIQLMDIVFEKVKIEIKSTDEINHDNIRIVDLELMQRLAKAEFQASLEKEFDLKENLHIKDTKVNPYDVWTIRRSILSPNVDVAVAIPVKKSKKLFLLWLDAEDKVWEVNKLSHECKIGSLSGVSRILEALDKIPPLPLMREAMNRKSIFDCHDHIHLSKTPNTFFERITSNRDVFQQFNEEDNNSQEEYLNYLNDSQRHAVQSLHSSNFEKGFFVMQGPPGTGKTSTLVQMILSSSATMIVTAPSNAAVANIALKLIETKRIGIDDVCVYGENSDPSVDFLNPKHRGREYKQFYEKYSKCADEKDKINEAKLKDMGNNDLSSFDDYSKSDIKLKKMKQDFLDWLHVDENISIKKIGNRCPLINDENRRLFSQIIGSAKVVLCTLNSSGSSFLRKSAGQRSLLFLDEAGQCPESEFYIATQYPGVKRIVVIGDHRQLPATVVSPECKKVGYGKSWMENVNTLYPTSVHLLNVQYRMDPKIINFSNKEFYDNRITSSQCVKDRYPSVAFPIRFIDTMNRGAEEKENFSWRNTYEANTIKSILKNDQDIRKIIEHNENAKIVIITPYQAQMTFLQTELKKMKGIGKWVVSTVDSFQGQEGEIVIVSTVRTKRVGFVDDPQRLNVALTRAKRALRIVGELTFFQKLPQSSTLRKLSDHCIAINSVHVLNIKRESSCPPDWNEQMLWKVTITQRFYECLKQIPRQKKNIYLNTLHALALPSCKKLYALPTENTSSWQVSSLKQNSQQHRVVWIAKEGMTIEAHFAGTYKQCLNFVQKYPNPPAGACKVKRDLSQVIVTVPLHENCVYTSLCSELSWKLNNSIQRNISQVKMDLLPQGCFYLDPQQRKIATSIPPLIIESRSGTGKTNVLFQHAIRNAMFRVTSQEDTVDDELMKRTCFITVSSRLSTKLKKQHDEVNLIVDSRLPPCDFFSLKQFLDTLLRLTQIKSHFKNLCTFHDYISSRVSHFDILIESTLIENEIGGVIMGSLNAACNKRPLTREEYLKEIRSNVSNHDNEGQRKREKIYIEYENYKKWKLKENVFDLHDIILRLINENLDQSHGQLYDAVYLDEVQDFSYATIYLISSLAGKDSLHWVFAGDTAQMISPGCSFKFAGLKQTLSAVQNGIEIHLRNVAHLLVNYRTTKDILKVGNAVLDLAKKYFPHAIEYAQPEIATKNSSIKVILCDWDEAMKTKPSFGKDQALIYSSYGDPEGIIASAHMWLKNHPFAMSAIDSKGLEFEDVVVAFDNHRRHWQISSQHPACLRLLRELYVAVTRAKQRVVILVPKKKNTMYSFFQELDCNLKFHDTKAAFVEFDAKTSKDDWFKKGEELFQDEKYEYASKCFGKACMQQWSMWACARHKVISESRISAGKFFREAAKFFSKEFEWERTLDVMKDLSSNSLWDSLDDQIYDDALRKSPTYLTREDLIKIDVFREKWDAFCLDDFKDPFVLKLIRGKRNCGELKMKISLFPLKDIAEISNSLPLIVGDLYKDMNKPIDAVKLYFKAGDHEAAVSLLDTFIDTKISPQKEEEIIELLHIWNKNKAILEHVIKSEDKITLFFLLFDNLEEAAKNYAVLCLNKISEETIKFAIRHSNLEMTELHKFNRNRFYGDIVSCLMKQYEDCRINIVQWFVDNDDMHNATKFASDNIQKWSEASLSNILALNIRSEILLKELYRRQRYVDITMIELEHRRVNKAIKSSIETLKWTNPRREVIMTNKITKATRVELMRNARKNAKKLYLIWKPKFYNSSIPKYIKKGSKLWVFFFLFLNPELASKEIPNECMNMLGADIVRDAVLQQDNECETDFITILNNFDNKGKKEKEKLEQKEKEKKQDSGHFQKQEGIQMTKKELEKNDRKIDKSHGDEDKMTENISKNIIKLQKSAEEEKRNQITLAIKSYKIKKAVENQEQKKKNEKLLRTKNETEKETDEPEKLNFAHGNKDRNLERKETDIDVGSVYLNDTTSNTVPFLVKKKENTNIDLESNLTECVHDICKNATEKEDLAHDQKLENTKKAENKAKRMMKQKKRKEKKDKKKNHQLC